MKNRLYITITDFRGVKCYSFDKIIKKYLIGIGAIFFIGVVLLITVLFILQKNINKYSFYKVENEKLYTLIEKSRSELEEKNLELENISEKVSEIEKIMGDDSTVNSTTLNDLERLDLTKLNVIDKKYLLQVIPNGNPVSFSSKDSSDISKQFQTVSKGKESHYGIDFSAPLGTEAIATADGIVEYAGFNSGGFGNLIIISHNLGFKTYYAHLSEIDVKIGEIISKGRVIGKIGNSGKTDTSHLHYEIHYLGKKIDPINFVKWNLENYDYIFKNEKGVKWQSLLEMISLQKQIIQQKN